MLLNWFRLLFSYQSAYKYWGTTEKFAGLTGYFERFSRSKSLFIGEKLKKPFHLIQKFFDVFPWFNNSKPQKHDFSFYIKWNLILQYKPNWSL